MQIYLDNAATSHPKPDCVIRAVTDAMQLYNGNPGRSGHRRALEAARIVLQCRNELAGLFSLDEPLSLIHAFNCTDALNMAIRGSLYHGDHVVVDSLCHNSVLRPIFGLERRGQIGVTCIDPADGYVHDPDDFAHALNRKTRLVVVTHVSNVTGTVQPVEAIADVCRRKGVRLLLDGAQAAGAIPVNLAEIGCDLYAFPGHKSLLGPTGTGGLYIRPGTTLSPYREGGTGTESDRLFQPEDSPERYESGTVNLHGIAGLSAGVHHVRTHLKQIADRERALGHLIYESLREIGATVYAPEDAHLRTGVISFNLPGLSSEAVADRLSDMNIQVRGGLHCAPLTHRLLGTLETGAVRASIGHATTTQDVEAFLEAIRQIARS